MQWAGSERAATGRAPFTPPIRDKFQEPMVKQFTDDLPLLPGTCKISTQHWETAQTQVAA